MTRAELIHRLLALAAQATTQRARQDILSYIGGLAG